MNIKISADSTCDLSPELIERYQIGIAPLYIVRDGESLVDGVDITPDQIYDHVSKSGSMCSTAAVSVYDYVTFFRKELETCDAVVHFHISEDMSACYQNACIAAAEVGNVYPVDSRNLSTGIGLLVLEAAELAREGKLTAWEIQQTMERRREQLDVSFLVERVDYLHTMISISTGSSSQSPAALPRKRWRRSRRRYAAISPLRKCSIPAPAAPSPATAGPAHWVSCISTPNKVKKKRIRCRMKRHRIFYRKI